MGLPLTSPTGIFVLSPDVQVISCDATAITGAGVTVTGIATKLTVGPPGSPGKAGPVLSDSPSYTTTSATQEIRGSELQPGTTYCLWWEFTLSSGNVITELTTVTCPQ